MDAKNTRPQVLGKRQNRFPQLPQAPFTGDISIELTTGTFLFRFDTEGAGILTRGRAA